MSDTGEIIQLWEAPFFDSPRTPQPRTTVAELQEAARAEGFERGKAEGIASGIAEAKAIAGRMTALADELAKPFRSQDTVVTRELAGVAVLLARQIVRRELTVDSTVVTDILDQALSTLYKLDAEIVVFLNPVDAAHLRELDHAPAALEGKAWKIVEDGALSPGGCQVKTPTSFVDASVEKQMELVFANLLDSCENMVEP